MDLLVHFSYTRCRASTLCLSTWSSFRGLIGKANLETSFALNMLSALIYSAHSYSAMLLVEQLIHQRCVHPGPLVLGATLLKFPNVHTGYKPNCLTTFWTQLAYHFNRRTAEPLGPAPAPGCDEPTSRCQTAPSMWTIGRDKPVIPGVTFIRLRCRYHYHEYKYSDSGSLTPTFVPARLVGLTVKLVSAFTLSLRFPSVANQPLNASATL